MAIITSINPCEDFSLTKEVFVAKGTFNERYLLLNLGESGVVLPFFKSRELTDFYICANILCGEEKCYSPYVTTLEDLFLITNSSSWHGVNDVFGNELQSQKNVLGEILCIGEILPNIKSFNKNFRLLFKNEDNELSVTNILGECGVNRESLISSIDDLMGL